MPRTQEQPTGPAAHETYRAASAPWLTGFLAALGLVVAVTGWGHTAAHHVGAACGCLALVALGLALYWRPRLEIRPEEVRLVNPVRTVSIPWERIVDVRTRFAVTIAVEDRTYSSFALPASGAGAALRAGADAVNRNHPIARPDGGVRVGDLTSTASGAAAHRVRTEWQRRIETGQLDVFAQGGDAEPVRTRVVAGPLAASAVLLAASAALYAV